MPRYVCTLVSCCILQHLHAYSLPVCSHIRSPQPQVVLQTVRYLPIMVIKPVARYDNIFRLCLISVAKYVVTVLNPFSQVKQGPPSLLLPAGYRMTLLPDVLLEFETVVVAPWTHEASVVPVAGLLSTLNGTWVLRGWLSTMLLLFRVSFFFPSERQAERLGKRKRRPHRKSQIADTIYTNPCRNRERLV